MRKPRTLAAGQLTWRATKAELCVAKIYTTELENPVDLQERSISDHSNCTSLILFGASRYSSSLGTECWKKSVLLSLTVR